MRIALFRICAATALLAAGYTAGRLTPEPAAAAAQTNRVFELRTYTANEGKLPALESRFRDHTIKFFDKYNMTSVGYWKPMDGPAAQTTLLYILAHPSREDAKKNFAAFAADPGWRKVRADSEKDGPILSKPPESMFMVPADYSPIK